MPQGKKLFFGSLVAFRFQLFAGRPAEAGGDAQPPGAVQRTTNGRQRVLRVGGRAFGFRDNRFPQLRSGAECPCLPPVFVHSLIVVALCHKIYVINERAWGFVPSQNWGHTLYYHFSIGKASRCTQRQEKEKLMAGKLDGKTALITGATSGIGEATALALAAEGASVAIAGRRADKLDALAKRITDAGGRAKAIMADVSSEDEARNMVLTANTEFGRIDILVNNAGVMLLGPITGADTEDWRRMIETNVMGLMYATHAALPLMQAQSSGHVVNISSVAGRTARSGSGVYNASKWGVGAFSESLRQEVCKNKIRVTIIEPGAVATELTQHITNPEAKKQTEEFYGSMTALESEDIAAAIVYAVTQPPRVNVNEILIRPTDQER